MEKLVVWTTCCCQKRSIKWLIIKNLEAHKLKNRRTGIMYAFSVAFMIFITVSYRLSVESSISRNLSKNGAYMVIDTNTYSNETTHSTENEKEKSEKK